MTLLIFVLYFRVVLREELAQL